VFALGAHILALLVLCGAVVLDRSSPLLWAVALLSLPPLLLCAAMVGWALYSRPGWVVIDLLLMVFGPGFSVLIPLSLNRAAKDKSNAAGIDVGSPRAGFPRAIR
jgi:hypothetical protein